jgi:16S rRNA A1518/A1519 N6-dimethyltransferase RsmA/KsgA/DIM1 with predicted DNA glycosylase/AP lyase activity
MSVHENRTQPQIHDLRPSAATRMVELAKVRPEDAVLEVGAGTGVLTTALVAAGARVVAVEREPARAAELRRRLEGRATIVLGDALELHPPLPPVWRAVANPPFNLTATLVRRWLLGDHPGTPAAAIDLLLQREAAGKLCRSEHGGHTRSSALIALAGRGWVPATLPRDATSPPSRVDLAVWSFRRGELALAEVRNLDRLLERAFAGAHSLGDALRGVASTLQLRRQGLEFGYRPDQHPRTLPAEAWLSLLRLLGPDRLPKPPAARGSGKAGRGAHAAPGSRPPGG